MPNITQGPSDNAWGADLTDPIMVSHQGLQVLFAREKNQSIEVIYFRILDPSKASDSPVSGAWNGWYRYWLPQATTSPPHNVRADMEGRPNERRIAGMDLLTVPPLRATGLAPADAAFRVISMGEKLMLFRASNENTLYMDQLVLVGTDVEEGRQTVTRYRMDVAWEVRFRRSGYRDVPLNDTDGFGLRDAAGVPFPAPTTEFEGLGNISEGLFDLVLVPTSNSEVSQLYCLARTANGYQLTRIQVSNAGVPDYASAQFAYPELVPTLASPAGPLVPIADIAPALAFYGEQETEAQADGEASSDIPRAARLICALPVDAGVALPKAMAIIDYMLNADGHVAILTAADQDLPLVDGTISGGGFVPDTTSAIMPNDTSIGSTLKVIDGLSVSVLVLGQIAPHASPYLMSGEDGLLHLYFGGPLPSTSTGRFDALDPSLPQALVAQCDVKVTRLALEQPWAVRGKPTETGTLTFRARLPGAVMAGTTVTVADAAFDGKSVDDLCDVSISYPAVTGFPVETWSGIPRDLSAFIKVLNGQASDDSADPKVLTGEVPFFDFEGRCPQVRVPLTPAPSTGVTPVLSFISTRTDLPLKSVTVAGSTLTMALGPGATTVTLTFPGLPGSAATAPDIFSGSADPATYAYPVTATDNAIFGLNTSTIGVDAPVLIYSTGAPTQGQTIKVEDDPNAADRLLLTVEPGSHTFPGLPQQSDAFAQSLAGDNTFTGLGLGISSGGTAGNVLTTANAVSAMGLADKAVLFDLIQTPDAPLAAANFSAGTHAAITQSHDPGGVYAEAAIAIYATAVKPESGLAALVSNGSATVSSTPVKSAGWVRQVPPKACTFSGADRVSVPVRDQGGVTLPQSYNLRPQRRWTMESWVKPDTATYQRLLTFNDGSIRSAPTSPLPQFDLATEGQKVVQFQSFTPSSAGMGVYFQTGVKPNAGTGPEGAFTVEVWVQPEQKAALPPISTYTPYGGILQFGGANYNPFFSLMLTRDRHVAVQTTDNGSTIHTYASTTQLAYQGPNGERVWSHLAVIARQGSPTGNWDLQLCVDGQVVDTFTNVELQTQGNIQVILGRKHGIDSSFFGSMALARYWTIARSISDIRRTWRTTLNGYETGLLGDWTMTGFETDPSGKKTLHNNAAATGKYYDADLLGSEQPVAEPQDSFFLSLIASVGEVQTTIADARLSTGLWNHVAVGFESGGALELNPESRYNQGVFDWAESEGDGSLGVAPNFAIDAWIEVGSGTNGEIGTIMAQWAPEALPENQGYRLWIDNNGALNFALWVIEDADGTKKLFHAKSNGWDLRDDMVHHVAVTVTSKNANLNVDPKVDASASITFILDYGTPQTTSISLKDIDIVEFQASSMKVTLARAYPSLDGDAPQAAEDFTPFRGKIGQLRYWSDRVTPERLFPEHQRNVPLYMTPEGLTAEWTFQEGKGRLALDALSGNDFLLNSSRPWSMMPETSALHFYSNGNFVGITAPYTTAREAVAEGQFTIGLPENWAGNSTNLGLNGELSTLALYDGLRSVEEIRSQRFMPRSGDEPNLLAAWDFSQGTDDITGGKNNIDPVPATSRIITATVPVTNESPVVRNIYGGEITRYSSSTNTRIAVGSYAVARAIGTDDQHAALMRDYVLIPTDAPDGGVQVGILNLIYLGQVQTDATLIGFIEGAPPVPSENLTRALYLSAIAYTGYYDTATVTLNQDVATTVTFSSSTITGNKFNADAAIGGTYIKSHLGLSTGSVITGAVIQYVNNIADHTVNFQFKAGGEGDWKSSTGSALTGSWLAASKSTMGVAGDWEPVGKTPDDYFNPTVGRRFVPDNLGYALVESLTADRYALTVGHTNTAAGIIIVPNPAIPPDRNVIIFPMDDHYTQQGTLDGKIGMRNAPAYPDADIRRGSYFKPVEAYAKARNLEAKKARALAFFEQRDVVTRAHDRDTSLADIGAQLPANFQDEPESPISVATPTTGIVNRYVWTSDGGLYSETNATKASYSRSYSGGQGFAVGGGFHIDGEHAFAKLGLKWSLDLAYTHRVDLTVDKSISEDQGLSVDVSVTGEALLNKFNSTLPDGYGGMGAYEPGAAAGKVKAYRFMTIYEPPSMSNSQDFSSIVDPGWLQQSNAPTARLLRSANLSNPTWRVMHRVTYVERVPPPIASRPIFTPDAEIREPVNLPGNQALIDLVLAQVPYGTPLTPEVISTAVFAAINPLPTAPGTYPAAALEAIVPWWGGFLTSARPDAQNQTPDPAAAAILTTLTTHVNDYILAGVATSVIVTPSQRIS